MLCGLDYKESLKVFTKSTRMKLKKHNLSEDSILIFNSSLCEVPKKFVKEFYKKCVGFNNYLFICRSVDISELNKDFKIPEDYKVLLRLGPH
ncbi:hypothetical protein A0H76_643 [Hepatospora eriocheir]|uniref:Uncharacterized protein n=1 Tax=Hepatospora eriocheir TaxID=1081669 RepID=A0A1X0Q7J5_9MICR|nr:hypothetical protein A0H76_643 [Hepatospora eriocheir]